MNYTDNQLKSLANNNPKELIRILNSPNANVKVLSCGAEILCEEITDETVVCPVLKKLLKHVHATVRESAMIGISAFYTSSVPPSDIIDRLKIMATNDPSPSLKEIALDLLKVFGAL